MTRRLLKKLVIEIADEDGQPDISVQVYLRRGDRWRAVVSRDMSTFVEKDVALLIARDFLSETS